MFIKKNATKQAEERVRIAQLEADEAEAIAKKIQHESTSKIILEKVKQEETNSKTAKHIEKEAEQKERQAKADADAAEKRAEAATKSVVILDQMIEHLNNGEPEEKKQAIIAATKTLLVHSSIEGESVLNGSNSLPIDQVEVDETSTSQNDDDIISVDDISAEIDMDSSQNTNGSSTKIDDTK